MQKRVTMAARNILAAGLLIGVLAVPNAAFAIPVSWNLSGVTYSDGGTASGSFVYDASVNLYSNISITTTAGSALPGEFYAEQLAGWIGNANGTYFVGSNAGIAAGDLAFELDLMSAMTDAGGTIGLNTGTWFTSEEGRITHVSGGLAGGIGWWRYATAGSISSTAVPEPGTLALFSLGLVGVGFARRRHARN